MKARRPGFRSATAARGTGFRACLAVALIVLVASCADMSFDRTGLVQGVVPGAVVSSDTIRARRDLTLEADAQLTTGSITISLYADGLPQGNPVTIAAPGDSITTSFPKAPGQWSFTVHASDDAAGDFSVHITDR